MAALVIWKLSCTKYLNVMANDNLWNVCRILSRVPSLPLLSAKFSSPKEYLFTLEGALCQYKTSRQCPILCTFSSTSILSNPTHFKVFLKQLKKKNLIKYIKVLLKQQLNITSPRNVAHFRSMLSPKVCKAYVGIHASNSPSTMQQIRPQKWHTSLDWDQE